MIFNQIPSLYNLYSLRWLDRVFQGQYLTSFSINYVAINKDLEKSPLQLYWINNGNRTECSVLTRPWPCEIPARKTEMAH